MMDDIAYMNKALEYALHAQALGEVPIGAIVVKKNSIVGVGYNRKEMFSCVTEHAEMMAIRDACRYLGNWRLNDCVVYSTLEPCFMCAGTLVHARVKRLVYGASDKKFGAVGSLYNLSNDTRLNHNFDVQSGVLAEEISELMKSFFKTLRYKQ